MSQKSFTKWTYFKLILYSTSPPLASPPTYTHTHRLSQSPINSQINILLHFKNGACLHLNMPM